MIAGGPSSLRNSRKMFSPLQKPGRQFVTSSAAKQRRRFKATSGLAGPLLLTLGSIFALPCALGDLHKAQHTYVCYVKVLSGVSTSHRFVERLFILLLFSFIIFISGRSESRCASAYLAMALACFSDLVTFCAIRVITLSSFPCFLALTRASSDNSDTGVKVLVSRAFARRDFSSRS